MSHGAGLPVTCVRLRCRPIWAKRVEWRDEGEQCPFVLCFAAWVWPEDGVSVSRESRGVSDVVGGETAGRLVAVSDWRRSYFWAVLPPCCPVRIGRSGSQVSADPPRGRRCRSVVGDQVGGKWEMPSASIGTPWWKKGWMMDTERMECKGKQNKHGLEQGVECQGRRLPTP